MVRANRRGRSSQVDDIQNSWYFKTRQVCVKSQLDSDAILALREFAISPALRAELKSPLGQLIEDRSVSPGIFEKYITENCLLVCVGDRTTDRIHDFHLSPNLEIVDFMEKRQARSYTQYGLSVERIIRAVNVAGTISSDSLEKLDQCRQLIQRDRRSTVRLVIEGEEDLLTLPVAAFFPEETVVFYGQPNEGLVVISSNEAKKRVRDILATIGITSLKNI